MIGPPLGPLILAGAHMDSYAFPAKIAARAEKGFATTSAAHAEKTARLPRRELLAFSGWYMSLDTHPAGRWRERERVRERAKP